MVLLGLWSSLAMAQAVRATVRAVKTSRKFVPRKAAIVLVSELRVNIQKPFI